MNRWYNKQVSTIKENKPQGFWNNKLAALSEKRNRQVRDGINKSARIVINHCLENDIGTVIFGWNKRNKDSINIGKKNNSEFVPIPTARLKDRIAQLCGQYGIQFVETEESYTSKSDFLAGDLLFKFGEKPEKYKFSGRRITRGTYKSKLGLICVDALGGINCLKKVATQLGISLAEVGRESLAVPKRYDLSCLRKSYRQSGEMRLQEGLRAEFSSAL